MRCFAETKRTQRLSHYTYVSLFVRHRVCTDGRSMPLPTMEFNRVDNTFNGVLSARTLASAHSAHQLFNDIKIHFKTE